MLAVSIDVSPILSGNAASHARPWRRDPALVQSRPLPDGNDDTVFADIFRALGANAVSINFAKAQEAFRQGIVDGHENPIALIIPHQLWSMHKHITLWRYTSVKLQVKYRVPR